jgi:hypothetical protein
MTSESAMFAGPRIAVSEYETTAAISDVIQGGPNAGDLIDYYANGTTFGSSAGWDSAGSCGPYLRSLDASYALSSYGLDCVGSLFDSDGISRSEIQVDGKNAYDPRSAAFLFDGACCTRSQDNSGFPSLTVSQNWNSSNGFESTTETDGIVECTGADGYLPPDQGACPSFQDAGVKLERAISMIGPSQVMMTDTWSSTDGHAHTVDAEYDDVQTLALAAQDLFKSPAVSITSPANDTNVKTSTVTVSGSAGSGSGISSLTVAGHAVRVGPNGTWSTTVALGKGANTITATATDNADQTASANITVIYAQQCVVPHVKGLSRSNAEKKIEAAGCLIGKIKKKHSKVKKGDAIGTKPGAGRTVAAGTKVKLIVSKGP